MAPFPESPRPPRATAAALIGGGLWLALAGLALLVPPDGREHGDLGEFVGRFHPLLVHVPVALLLVVPLMDLASRLHRRADLAIAAGWVLALAVFAAYTAAIDGWLLAWSGGFRGRDVTRHMWGGVWLSAVSAAALWARARAPRAAYVVLITASVALVAWTGHFGGALSHGDGFLTDKMPGRMRGWFGMAPMEAPAAPITPAVPAGPSKDAGGAATADPASPLYYEVHVAPLFARSCVSCHKADKHKGGLRMDTYELLMRGGSDGPALVPGHAATSEILRRVRLPVSDDDYMPSNGEKPLTAQEMDMVERWIAAGARGR